MNALVSLSGGMDSTVLLHRTVATYGASNVEAVTFSYGAKHGPWETKAANRVAFNAKILHYHFINVAPVFSKFSSHLLYDGGPIPEGHYTDASMRKTIVPARNAIFASIMTGLAQSRGIRHVYLGIHAGDHAIYPDCRPAFFESMRQAMLLASDGAVLLEAPFINMTKKDILMMGLTLNAPFELTRTCYSNNFIACGKCGACTERLEAYAQAGMTDPIEYVE